MQQLAAVRIYVYSVRICHVVPRAENVALLQGSSAFLLSKLTYRQAQHISYDVSSWYYNWLNQIACPLRGEVEVESRGNVVASTP